MSKPKEFNGMDMGKGRNPMELENPRTINMHPDFPESESEWDEATKEMSKPKLNEFDLKDITFEERKVLLHALLPDEEAEKHLEMLIKESRQETLKQVNEIVDWEKHYPLDIFPELSKKELGKVNALLYSVLKFPLDRLSAHISREILKGIKQELEKLK